MNTVPPTERTINHPDDPLPLDLDVADEAEYMVQLRMLRDRSGLSLKEIETTWRRRFPSSKHAIGKSALGELFTKDTLPRRPGQLQELLTLLIEERSGRTSEIHRYYELGTTLLQQRARHKRHNTTPQVSAEPAANGTAHGGDINTAMHAAEEHTPPPRVMELAAQHRHGEYVRVYESDQRFAGTMALVGGGLILPVGGGLILPEVPGGLGGLFSKGWPIAVLLGSATLLALFVVLVRTLTGATVLYMFTGGVVVSRKAGLRSYAWTDLSAHRCRKVFVLAGKAGGLVGDVVLDLLTKDGHYFVFTVRDNVDEVAALARRGGAHTTP